MPLDYALWCAAESFQRVAPAAVGKADQSTSRDARRVFIFSCDDSPCGRDSATELAVCRRAHELRQAGDSISVYGLVPQSQSKPPPGTSTPKDAALQFNGREFWWRVVHQHAMHAESDPVSGIPRDGSGSGSGTTSSALQCEGSGSSTQLPSGSAATGLRPSEAAIGWSGTQGTAGRS